MPGIPSASNIAVVPPAQLEQQLAQQAQQKAQAADAASKPAVDMSPLAGYVRGQYEIFRNHRNTNAGWSERLLQALRTFNGQYDSTKLAQIKRFGGSEIYARLIAQKCRSASSLLRDVYLGADRPWALDPPEDPDVPPHIIQSIETLVQQEVQQVAQQTGQPPPADQLEDRRLQLMDSARTAAFQRATQQAEIAGDKIEELIRQGGFYHALAEFLVDLPIFPFACIKGPVVKIKPEVVWPEGGGKPTVVPKPRLCWYRVSPFDIWFTPGVSDIADANVIEKSLITRADLNDMLDLPGYDVDAVRKALDAYGRGGLYDAWDTTDSERAVLENRENPAWNRSGLITMLEFNGNVLGQTLKESGQEIDDPQRDYHVQVWVIGQFVVKSQLSPSPRVRHPYFITSFEKVPGTPVGNGLTDILGDIQDVANATLRSLVNNMSIASGPQVVLNIDRMDPNENVEDMYPWKRWRMVSDPTSNNAQPAVTFFQPQSNAGELMQVFEKFSQIADDISAIPKYMQGGSSGGAGRTASGLAMLMGNASKLLQTVSANVDRDVMEPCFLQLFDLILLTDTSGILSGEEKVTIMGVNVAVQRETIRQRQMEMLQHTQNPIDMKILGLTGRGALLRAVSTQVGLPGETLVPPDQKLAQMQAAQEKAEADPQAQKVTEAIQKGVVQGATKGASDVVTQLIETQIPAKIAQGMAAAQQQLGMPGGIPGPGGPPPGQSGQPSPGGPPGGGPPGAGPPGAAPQGPPQPPKYTGPPPPPRHGSAGHGSSGSMTDMALQGQGTQTKKPLQGPGQLNLVTPAKPKGIAPGV